MGDFGLKRICRYIILALLTFFVVFAWETPLLGQIPFSLLASPSPSQSSSSPWNLNQAFPCGKFWCSNVYLLKSDTRLKTALAKRSILTPELIVTATGEKSEPPQNIAQQAEQRAQLVQRTFAQTLKQVLDSQTLSTVPFHTNLAFWLPLSLQGLNLPIIVKPPHPWTPQVEIGTKNQQTVIYLPAQPDLGLASQVFVTLTPVDARVNGKTIEQLAKLWRVNIQLSFSNALWGYELDRQHPLLRWQLAGVILGGSLLLIWMIEVIRGFLGKWNHHLRHKLDALRESLAIEPEAMAVSSPTSTTDSSSAESQMDSPPETTHTTTAAPMLSEASPSSGPDPHSPRGVSVWRTVHSGVNRLLGFTVGLYRLIRQILPKNQWLSPRFYISDQKRVLRQQTAIKQQRNFCLLLLAQMLIAEILTFAIGLTIILYTFRATRLFSAFLFEKTIFLIAIWIGLIFIDKLSAFLIDYYLNRWATEAQATNPTSNRYTLRVNTYSLILKRGTSFLVLFFGGYITIASLGVNPGVLAGAGIFAVAIAFLGRSLVEDMLNGILILWTDRYAIGDVVDLGGSMAGAVENITLFITTLRNLDGDAIAIPNSQITAVTNKTKYWSRVNFTIRIAWNQDIDQATAIMTTVADAMQQEPEWEERILEPVQILGVDDVSYEGILIHLLIKTQPCEQWNVGREFRRRVKQAFDQADIRVGIPHQTITLLPTATEQGA